MSFSPPAFPTLLCVSFSGRTRRKEQRFRQFPARSTSSVAIFAGDWALTQLWLFWLAPIVGAILGAVIYRYIGTQK